MTGVSNYTSLGGCGLFSGRLEHVCEVTRERLNECQIISSTAAGLREVSSAQVDKKTHTFKPIKMITVSVPHCLLCSLPCWCKSSAHGAARVLFAARKALSLYDSSKG